MPYRVLITNHVGKSLARLDAGARRRIYAAMRELEHNPRPSSVKALHGGGFRIRVGSYRALYTIDDGQPTVTIYEVGHRKDAYR